MRESLKFGLRHPRYFVDLALAFVLVIEILQVMHSVGSWPASTWDLRDLVVGVAGILVCVLFAKEIAVTLGIALAYIFIMGMIRLPLEASSHSAPQIAAGVVMFLAAGAGALAIAIWGRKKTEFYQSGRPWVDRIIVALAVVFAIVLLLKPLKLSMLYYTSR